MEPCRCRVRGVNPPGGGGTDTDAIHDNVSGEIAALTEVVPARGDTAIIDDASDSDKPMAVDVSRIAAPGQFLLDLADRGVDWDWKVDGATDTQTALVASSSYADFDVFRRVDDYIEIDLNNSSGVNKQAYLTLDFTGWTDLYPAWLQNYLLGAAIEVVASTNTSGSPTAIRVYWGTYTGAAWDEYGRVAYYYDGTTHTGEHRILDADGNVASTASVAAVYSDECWYVQHRSLRYSKMIVSDTTAAAYADCGLISKGPFRYARSTTHRLQLQAFVYNGDRLHVKIHGIMLGNGLWTPTGTARHRRW